MIHAGRRGGPASPHGRVDGQQTCVLLNQTSDLALEPRLLIGHGFGYYLLALNLGKYQPAVVPASRTCRIPNHQPFCFVQTLGAERVIPGQTAQLAEEVVRVDVMRPGAGHRLRNFGRIEVCKNLFNPAQFGQSVDTVGPQGVHKLIFVILK